MSRPVRCGAVMALVALLSALLVGASTPAAQAADKDCADFASQRAAQIFFLNHGGPQSDPHRLDADGDGIACETNPAPYYFGTTPPGSTPAPAPVVQSVVRLSTTPSRAIAGEPVRFHVRVRPRLPRTVILQRQRAGGGWARVGAMRTNAAGRATMRRAARPATTRYRAVVARTRVNGKRYSAATSQVRRVVTQRQSVALSLPAATLTGTTVAAVVTAAPVRPGRPVVLQRRTAVGWSSVGTGTQSRYGRARFAVRARAAGTFAYRAVVRAHRGAAAVRSQSRRLRIVDPVPEDLTPPPVPAGLAGVPGDGQVELSWSPVSATDLAGYRVYRGSVSGPWVRVATVADTTAVVSGLANQTEYLFAVSAFDSSGNESQLSAAVSVTPAAPDRMPPDAPSGLQADAGDSQVSLSWAGVAAPDLAGYVVYRRVAPEGEWVRVDGALLASTSATVTGLVNGTEYDFVVTAVDRAGNESAASAPVSATPATPVAAAPERG